MHPETGESGALPTVEGDGNGGDDGRGSQQRSRWSRVWPWLLALLVLALIGGGVAAFLATRPTKDTVPVVVNDTQQEATAKVEAAGFDPQVIQQASTSTAGTVIDQSPLGGTRANSGTTVELTISSGPGSTTVPAVVQLSRTQAIAQLHLAGLKVSRVLSEPSTTVPKGEATRTDPDAGIDLQTGQGVVLYISTGVAPVSVPTVTGDTVQTAQAALSAFSVSITQKASSTAQPGTVLSQTPLGGTSALPGSRVALVVAEKEPTVTVPNLVGQTTAEATSTVTGLGLKVKTTAQLTATSTDNGKVLFQTPVANGKAAQGATVTLVIGKYSATATTTGTGTTTTGTGTVTTTPSTGTTTSATSTATTATTPSAEATTKTPGFGGIL
jgi:eukaryotic-like serine/threonine-protein kinase